MLRLMALLSFLLMSGCLQTENSNSQDTSFANDGSSPEFQAARTVLIQYCASCHLFASWSEEKLISSGRVIAGDAEGSRLYYRIQGSSGTGGDKNMPQNGSIAPEDADVIKTWIDGIQ